MRPVRAGIGRLLAVGIAYAMLLAAVTYPQVRSFGSAIAADVDPYFSIWRLAWIAHQLPRDPAHLFDANIFFPERHTLAYSDALIAPGVVAAPLFWLHASPALIYNLSLVAGFVLSGLAAFLLVKDLTRCTAAAAAAGAFFMCAPFRFDHYVHLELQLTFCMPIGLLALHRMMRTQQWRWAIVAGACVGLQTLCSVYYGVFFGTFLATVAAALLVLQPGGSVGRRLVLLAVAGGLAVAIVAPYLTSYLAARQTVGSRSEGEVLYYSAVPADYLSARADNWMYGKYLTRHGGEERHLFPGVLVLIAAALSLWRMPRLTWVYLVAGAFAFDASLGLHGHVFPWLRALLLPYQGLRVPARFAMLVALSLSVLAGIGVAELTKRWNRTSRLVLVAAVFVVVGLEARTAPVLVKPVQAGPVDVWLAAQPRSPLLELPLPPPEQPFQFSEGQHIYQSIFHWQPLVNGISGFWPASYLLLLDRMRTFPDAGSLAYLATRHVRYIVVRQSYFAPDAYAALRAALVARPELTLAARFAERQWESLVFELR